MGTTIIMTKVRAYMEEWFKWYTTWYTRVLDVADDKDDDDDGTDDDDDDIGDDVVSPPCMVRKIPFFSLPIPPPDELRRLGFCLLNEFLVSLHVWHPIQFHGVEVLIKWRHWHLIRPLMWVGAVIWSVVFSNGTMVTPPPLAPLHHSITVSDYHIKYAITLPFHGISSIKC